MECDMDFLDVGYMGENFDASDIFGKLHTIKRSDKKAMQIFIALPSLDDGLINEIQVIDKFFDSAQVPLHCCVVFGKLDERVKELSKSCQKCQILIDSEDEFGGMYGVGDSETGLSKTLFVLGREGAIYHVQTPLKPSTAFDLEQLRIELNKTFLTYNGVGCHG